MLAYNRDPCSSSSSSSSVVLPARELGLWNLKACCPMLLLCLDPFSDLTLSGSPVMQLSTETLSGRSGLGEATRGLDRTPR